MTNPSQNQKSQNRYVWALQRSRAYIPCPDPCTAIVERMLRTDHACSHYRCACLLSLDSYRASLHILQLYSQVAEEPKFPTLSEEAKKEIVNTNDFQSFFDKSTKTLER